RTGGTLPSSFLKGPAMHKQRKVYLVSWGIALATVIAGGAGVVAFGFTPPRWLLVAELAVLSGMALLCGVTAALPAVLPCRKLRASDGRVETVDHWPTLGEVLWEMACHSWEDPANVWLSYVVEEATGLVAATAVFGPDGALLVACSDGRRFRFPVPEFYRECG